MKFTDQERIGEDVASYRYPSFPSAPETHSRY